MGLLEHGIGGIDVPEVREPKEPKEPKGILPGSDHKVHDAGGPITLETLESLRDKVFETPKQPDDNAV